MDKEQFETLMEKIAIRTEKDGIIYYEPVILVKYNTIDIKKYIPPVKEFIRTITDDKLEEKRLERLQIQEMKQAKKAEKAFAAIQRRETKKIKNAYRANRLVQTPDGIYASILTAANHYGVSMTTMRTRINDENNKEFNYVEGKETKETNTISTEDEVRGCAS